MSAPPLDPAAARAAIEHCYEQGWTDGLPVVPATPELVAELMRHVDRDPNEVIGRMDHLNRTCTVQQAAINAIMAGCRPEYFPVVLAAWEALKDEGSAFGGGWQSTTGVAPLLIVNGPVRNRLGFNSRGNVFGPGFRANATVGRAIRLIILNAFGIRPHVLDQSTQGTTLKYTFCIAENEEDSPWEPLHVERGWPPEDSTVAALIVRSCEPIDNRQTADPAHILADIADTISRTGLLGRATNHAAVVLGPEHARLLARNGLSKADVKRFLVEHCGRRQSDYRRVGRGFLDERGQRVAEPPERPGGAEIPDDELVRIVASVDDVVVVVAGAENGGVSAVMQMFNAFTPRRVPGMSRIEAVAT